MAYPLYSWFESRLFKLSDKISSTSSPYLETSRALTNFNHKCQVAPLGLEVEKRVVEETDSKLPTPLKVLVIARLTYYKGHRVLLDALAKLRGFDICVDIAGTGELEAKLKQAAIDKGVSQQLLWHGAVTERKNYLFNSVICCVYRRLREPKLLESLY